MGRGAQYSTLLYCAIQCSTISASCQQSPTLRTISSVDHCHLSHCYECYKCISRILSPIETIKTPKSKEVTVRLNLLNKYIQYRRHNIEICYVYVLLLFRDGGCCYIYIYFNDETCVEIHGACEYMKTNCKHFITRFQILLL